MRKSFKPLILPAIIALTFALPQAIQSMQLIEGADGTLGAEFGGCVLKMSINLNALKAPIEKEQLEVPVHLLLADHYMDQYMSSSSYISSPTRPSADFKVKIGCESEPLAHELPDEPSSFDSFASFTNWMNQGCLYNETKITYDFHVDIDQLIPFFVQDLHNPYGSYHFIGRTYLRDNTAIKPDQCVPQVTYSSKRDTQNVTTATLSGAFYLNNHAVARIGGYYHRFPHPTVEEIIIKKDETKKFYSHKKWIAQSEVVTKITFEEFPNNQLVNWPNAPSGTYSLLRKKPSDLKEIECLTCWDSSNGNEVDLPYGEIFLVVYEAINKKDAEFIESTVKDDRENMYITRYQYSSDRK